ncbi:MAG TPA: tetratricopeptide repeat protein [Terriglobia bacterium]|nr:tetratricopeptide repeat protein [Terriglobia bacterium]
MLLCSLSGLAQNPTAPPNLEEAQRAFDAGRYAEALDLFQRVQTESPQCEIYFFIGLTQYRLGRLDDAIASLASSVGCNPRFSLGEHALGDAYVAKGDDNRALAAYEAGLKIEPDDPEALRAASLICLKHELNARAVPLLERYIKLQPGDLNARADLGSAYAATSEIPKAEEQYRAALAVDARNPPALLGLGALYVTTSRQEKAIPLLLEAAKLVPNSAKPLALLGTAYNRLGRYGEAAEVLEKAAQISPDDPSTYYKLGEAYGHLQRPADRKNAMERFAQLTDQSQKLLEAKREAARLVLNVQGVVDRGDDAKALQMMERAHDLDPNNDEALYRLGGLYLDAEKYDLARNCAEAVTKRAPSEWRYWYLLGMVQTAEAQWEQAQASFEQVVQIDPGRAEAYNELGNLAMKQRQPDKAVKAYQLALKTNPQNAAYRENLTVAQKAAAREN